MRSYLTLLALTATLLHIQGQVVLNEVIYSPQQTVELKNVGSTTIEVGTLWLCSFPTYTQIQNMTVVSGTTTMAPGDILVVSGHGYAAADDELGLYTANSFGNSANIIDYVEWGSTGHARSSVAVAAGIWTTGDFVDNVGGAASLEYDGEGDASSDWAVSVVSTEGQENSNVDVPCDASAFAVGSQTICPGDTAVFQVVLTGIAPWTFTYSRDGVIEEPVNTSLSPHPWELTLEGTYNLVSVTDATCEGTAQGTVQVNHHEIPTATLIGPDTFCSTDTVPTIEVDLTGTGPWTFDYELDGEQQGTLEFDSSPGSIPFSGAGVYTPADVSDSNCQGEVSGSIEATIIEVDGGELSVNGGTESWLVCADDGNADAFDFEITGGVGDVSQMVITDASGVILSLPSSTLIDFEGSGAGTVLVWHMRYATGLSGLVEGNQIPDDIIGCYALSNPIEIVKETGADCTTGLSQWDAVPFSIFPNPVVDRLQFELKEKVDELQIQILAVTGEVVYSEQTLSTGLVSIDLSFLSRGLYQIMVTDGNGRLHAASFTK